VNQSMVLSTRMIARLVLQLAGLLMLPGLMTAQAEDGYFNLPSPESSQSVSAPESLVTHDYPPSPPIPANFEKDFKINDLFGLNGRIAFSTKIRDFDRILVLDLDARRIRRLIDGPGNNSYPSWSPDGTRLVFTSDRDGQKDIYIADWDGTNQRRLTYNAGNDDNASWSPDGQRIVYYSEQDSLNRNPSAELAIISANGGTPQIITSYGGRNTTPRWSPDGSKIAYSTNRHWPGWSVCLLELVSSQENCFLTGAQTYCRPMWSASGNSLAYTFGIFDNLNIAIHSFGTNSQRTVSSLNGREYDVVWAPDDKWIAFVSDVGKKEHFNIYARNLDEGGKVVEILSSPYSKRYLSWSGVKTLELEAKRIIELEQPKAGQKEASPNSD